MKLAILVTLAAISAAIANPVADPLANDGEPQHMQLAARACLQPTRCVNRPQALTAVECATWCRTGNGKGSYPNSYIGRCGFLWRKRHCCCQ